MFKNNWLFTLSKTTDIKKSKIMNEKPTSTHRSHLTCPETSSLASSTSACTIQICFTHVESYKS